MANGKIKVEFENKIYLVYESGLRDFSYVNLYDVRTNQQIGMSVESKVLTRLPLDETAFPENPIEISAKVDAVLYEEIARMSGILAELTGVVKQIARIAKDNQKILNRMEMQWDEIRYPTKEKD